MGTSRAAASTFKRLYVHALPCLRAEYAQRLSLWISTFILCSINVPYPHSAKDACVLSRVPVSETCNVAKWRFLLCTHFAATSHAKQRHKVATYDETKLTSMPRGLLHECHQCQAAATDLSCLVCHPWTPAHLFHISLDVHFVGLDKSRHPGLPKGVAKMMRPSTSTESLSHGAKIFGDSKIKRLPKMCQGLLLQGQANTTWVLN
jgi:hypothetical protein